MVVGKKVLVIIMIMTTVLTSGCERSLNNNTIDTIETQE